MLDFGWEGKREKTIVSWEEDRRRWYFICSDSSRFNLDLPMKLLANY